MIAQELPPPEAELIRRRRETAVPAMSRRQAAAKAGISPSQWSDVERGSKKAGPGVAVPVHASAETLAKMAQVIGATPDELTAVGREDAASELRDVARDRLLRQRIARYPRPRRHRQPGGQRPGKPPGPAAPDRPRTGCDRGQQPPARTKQQLTSLFADNLRNDATRRYEELLLILRLAESGSAG